MTRVGTVHLYVHAEGDRAVWAAPLLEGGREVIWLEDEGELSAALPTMEALGCGGLPALDYTAAARLRLVQLFGAGIDHVAGVDLPPRVHLTSSRGIHGGEIRDHALAMMLTFARELPRVLELQARAEWTPFAAGTLAGATLAILGLGTIGRSVAAAGRALGMHVVGTRASGAPVPEAARVWPPEGTREALASCDYAVVCLPLTARTRGLLNATMLEALRPNAVLVHISRGGIVDEAALADMLRAGRLRGAALDVFEREPLPKNSALWATPRLVVSAHIAGLSHDYLARATASLAENLRRLEAGEPLATEVDLARGY